MYPKTRMRRLRREILRPIFTETRLSPDAFCLPLFFDETAEEEIPISSMPGQVRYPLSAAEPLAQKLYAEGVRSVILFGIPKEKWIAAIENTVAPKFVEMNKVAFELGYNA